MIVPGPTRSTPSHYYNLCSIRLKIAFTLLLLLVVVTTPRFERFDVIFLIATLSVWTILAHPSVKTILVRLGILIPFYLMIVLPVIVFTEGRPLYEADLYLFQVSITDAGLYSFINLFIKTSLSFYILFLFTLSDPSTRIFSGIRSLFLPKIMLNIVFVTLKYIEVIGAQAQRMLRARAARTFHIPFLTAFRSSGSIAGTLFIRSARRGQAIHNAMLSRGYSGESFILPDFQMAENANRFRQKVIANSICTIVILFTGAVLLARIADGV
ncbi:energy-coupling factor transporter transmembrane component T family protein [candidate division KSB1 bacterium]